MIRFLESSEWGEVYCSFLVWKRSWFVYLVIFNFFVSCRVYCRKHKKTAHNSEGTSFSHFLISRGNLSKINQVRGINEMVFHSFQLYDFYCPLTLNHCKRLHTEEREFTELIQASHHSNLRDRIGRNQNLKLTFWGTANCFPKWLHPLFSKVATYRNQRVCVVQRRLSATPSPAKSKRSLW